MDAKVQKFLDKARVVATKTGRVAVSAADAAGKKAGDLALATKINLQIFDFNMECELLYKELGKMVYDVHQGLEIANEELESRMAILDEKQSKILALREELASMRAIVLCSNCGRQCGKEDVYCSKCGSAL